MEEEKTVIIDSLTQTVIGKFLDNGYMVHIYPFDGNVAVMAMKIGIQGGHYVAEHLEDALVSLLMGMKEADEKLGS